MLPLREIGHLAGGAVLFLFLFGLPKSRGHSHGHGHGHRLLGTDFGNFQVVFSENQAFPK